MIEFDAVRRVFHLGNRHFSYLMHIMDGRFLAHLYWGEPLGAGAPVEIDTLIYPAAAPYLAVQTRGAQPTAGRWPWAAHGYSLDTLPQEYPVWGTGEQRSGALEATLADGTGALRLEYDSHEISAGVAGPAGLPTLREDHDLGATTTVRVRLSDPRGDLTVDLFYTVAEEAPTLLRWTRVTNSGTGGSLALHGAASASWDLPPDHYDVVTLAGAWARERHVVRTPVTPGRHSVGTRAGASSHQSSPFIALCTPETDEERGQVWAAGLMYSGSFGAAGDSDQYGACRTSIGMAGYRGHLEPGESVDTPVAALVHSADGFGGMSAAFHSLLRDGIVASRWRSEPRRTIINSWEAMYFDLDADRVTRLARAGREIGAELLVLDDGWFSGRRDDTASLGDWWVNRDLFPDGLAPVADAVRREGLEFGVWIEPEMVSPDSHLCREHPDWFLQIPGREPTLARHQLTLDLSNPEVVDHVFETVSAILRESTASYIKWDMNRAMTEAGSPALPAERQGEVMHRYILGLYDLLERLTSAFPHVLFEGCAGGGGRFDMGLARYSPRFWTSDQTDAIERLDVQYGTSLVFPPEMIGAHVSSVPNHQVGRVTPAWTRVLTAAAFSYGYELDPERESGEDRAVFAEGSTLYRRIREAVMNGRFTRLGSASGAGGAAAPASGAGSAVTATRATVAGDWGGARAWMVEADDGSEVFVFHVHPLARTNQDPGSLRLAGLRDGDGVPVPGSTVYRDGSDDRRYTAAQLRSRGLHMDPGTDHQARFWHLVRE